MKHPLQYAMLQPELHIFFFLSAVMLLSSCGTSKYVNQDQSLLDSKKIEFVDNEKIKDKGLLKLELESFYEQEPNSHFFWLIPREWFYFKNSDPGDTSWFKKWVKKYGCVSLPVQQVLFI